MNAIWVSLTLFYAFQFWPFENNILNNWTFCSHFNWLSDELVIPAEAEFIENLVNNFEGKADTGESDSEGSDHEYTADKEQLIDFIKE